MAYDQELADVFRDVLREARREVARRAFEEPPDGIRCIYCGFDHPGKQVDADDPRDDMWDCVKALRGELQFWMNEKQADEAERGRE